MPLAGPDGTGTAPQSTDLDTLVAGPDAPDRLNEIILKSESTPTKIQLLSHFRSHTTVATKTTTTNPNSYNSNPQKHLKFPPHHHNITKMTDQKTQKIEETRSNLPLPEQPPVASDWNSADASKVNVGSGGVSSDVSTGAGSSAGLREPASKADADLSGVGRQGKDNLEGLPKDAKAK
ncbi:hypothetical protein F4777DRAFT_581598 [Nemania sp. FL0916]|nr:hypothetical protein F4777DRAFT_581598 [Nemania sp. FL0916]